MPDEASAEPCCGTVKGNSYIPPVFPESNRETLLEASSPSRDCSTFPARGSGSIFSASGRVRRRRVPICLSVMNSLQHEQGALPRFALTLTFIPFNTFDEITMDITHSSKLLVRHPAPYPTESCWGYCLRLAEENGYPSPWSLVSLSGMRMHELKSTSLQATKLAEISNRSTSELEYISYRTSRLDPKHCCLLGHTVLPGDLSLCRPKLCPACVAENGYIEAHWDVALMVGCPIHLCRALDRCPECRRALSWYRPGCLKCCCGANLANAALASIPGAEGALLDIIRTKVLGTYGPSTNIAKFPSSQLHAMSLRCLLSLIRSVGKHRLRADGFTMKGATNTDLVFAASRVLFSWPQNFFQLLRDIGERSSVTSGAARQHCRRQFSSIYLGLFRNIQPPEQVEFVRRAFLTFSKSQRKQKNQSSQIYSARDAAKMIGVPISVLQDLKAGGEFEVKHMSPTKRGFHAADIEAFKGRLCSFADSQLPKSSQLLGCVPLRRVMKVPYRSAHAKANIVRAVLEGRLLVQGCADESVGGLLFRASSLRSCSSAMPSNGNTRTSRDVTENSPA